MLETGIPFPVQWPDRSWVSPYPPDTIVDVYMLFTIYCALFFKNDCKVTDSAYSVPAGGEAVLPCQSFNAKECQYRTRHNRHKSTGSSATSLGEPPIRDPSSDKMVTGSILLDDRFRELRLHGACDDPRREGPRHQPPFCLLFCVC